MVGMSDAVVILKMHGTFRLIYVSAFIHELTEYRQKKILNADITALNYCSHATALMVTGDDWMPRAFTSSLMGMYLGNFPAYCRSLVAPRVKSSQPRHIDQSRQTLIDNSMHLGCVCLMLGTGRTYRPTS